MLNDGWILVKTAPHALQPAAPEGLPRENSVKEGEKKRNMERVSERARSQPLKYIHCSHEFLSLFFISQVYGVSFTRCAKEWLHCTVERPYGIYTYIYIQEET